MKNRFVVVSLVAVVALAVASFASAVSFNVNPGVFIGTAAQCGGPAGHDIVGADWVSHFGLPDDSGHQNQALMLSKNGPTTDCSAAGATITGNGMKTLTAATLTELGFDIRNGGHCGAGAPRFNVVDSSNTLFFVGGCSNGTQTADTPAQGWTRVRFVIPAMAAGKIKSIEIVFDEGTDTGPDFSGFAMLDNIDINGTLVTKN